MTIKINEILKMNIAISESQAEDVVEIIDIEDNLVLDFEGISDVSTAFFNIILDLYWTEKMDPKSIIKKISFVNYNDSVVFAFGDAFGIYKKRYLKHASK